MPSITRPLSGKLEYFDIRELQDTITSKALWERFEPRFTNKETLIAKFNQLAELRNGIRHSRTVDESHGRRARRPSFGSNRCSANDPHHPATARILPLGAATLLRGTIDAGDYKQFIFPLLFYKRLCDVFDEETETALKESGGDADFAAYPENHRFQVPPEAHWREVRQVAKNIGQTLQAAMRTIETANPDKLYGIFGDAQWTNKDRLSDAMLRDLVEHFSTLELTLANLPEDELGRATNISSRNLPTTPATPLPSSTPTAPSSIS